MKTSTATLAEISRMAGKRPPNVLKALRRAGVQKSPAGRYNTAKALDVLAEGSRQDKSKQEEQLREMAEQGVRPDNLLYKAKIASIRRVALQGDLLEIERDKARGELIPIAEYKERLMQMQNVCVRIMDVFIETVSAKRADAKLHEELICAREHVLNETASIIDQP